MFKKRLINLAVAALAVCAFGALSVGQASAATLEKVISATKTPFVAIYGNPGSNGEAIPVGGGLGRNFGFGANMLFQACSGCTPTEGENLSFEFGTVKAEAKDSYIGGTLMSNKTGENNPLSFAIQFADFQNSKVGESGVESYSDTYDQPWITEICSSEAGTVCKPDPRKEVVGGATGLTKISNVAINLGPGFVVQGTVWANWGQGKAKSAPCLTLASPPAVEAEGIKADTLYVTQTTTGFPAVGTPLKAIKGKVCLISANNDWYSIKAGEVEEPEIKISK